MARNVRAEMEETWGRSRLLMSKDSARASPAHLCALTSLPSALHPLALPSGLAAPAMPVVWMYQHPSNKNTYRQFADSAASKLEDDYQSYVKHGMPELTELHVGPDRSVAVVVGFKYPMKHSPTNNITRQVRRFVEQ